ncbi:type IVB secretion system protein IcmH/DotU [Falsihalocynthiibacter sp. BN13B15]|uniref:type IVB secretion system protein IcmH/DotU n=1 Tax=Falsihalocynthiibacter sp. BN13B15 TaxID=3240871 RepID=UPI00350F3C21
MSDDDPFAEPNDNERTVIRPNPGGRRPASAPFGTTPAPAPAAPSPADYNDPAGFNAPAPAPAAPAPSAPSPQQDQSAVEDFTGLNPIHAAASTLFSLVSRIRNRAQHADPETMRRSVIAEVRAFENRAMQAKIDPQTIKVARYAICATLDDVVLNTPWGGASTWGQQSLVATFHRETVGGDRFYDLLARLEKDPAQNIDLLEFLYVCLSLGFEGRLRVEAGGVDKHMNIRTGLARIIRTQKGDIEHDLSPHWMGLNKPLRQLSAWKPFWISVGALAAVMTIVFLVLSNLLSNSTDKILAQFTVIDPTGIAELERRAPPVVVEPSVEVIAQKDRVSEILKAEIDEGLVSVFQDANTITVRIKGKDMFKSASDSLTPAFLVPLSRVANALNDTRGQVIIAGHSDSSPIRSARFKNNMALSLARAEMVRKSISPELDEASRLVAEGRSDTDPIASNDTSEGRAENRRIEIILLREELTE